MKETIDDIKNKLDEGLYKNEEHIRLSLVSRILKKLDWDIWEPQEVFPEFSPDKGRNKVDIALFVNSFNPPIFIEIKTANTLRNPNGLANAETQLRDYNVDLTALFTILTDGNYWRFYYSQEGGTFAQKCFKIIEIQKDDSEDIALAFLTFLQKCEIINGNAKKEAFEYLQLSRKQQIMEECIFTAKRELENDPLLTLVKALCNVVSFKGISISENEALEFLTSEKNKKQSKINTPPTVSVKLPDNLPSTIQHAEIKEYTLSNQYDLAFTTITFGEINNEKANNWQNLLKVLVRQLITKGVSIEEIRKITKIFIKSGNITGNGFSEIPQTNYSMQGLEANRIGIAILLLSQKYKIKVNIQFRWRDKPGQAVFPNENCRIRN